MELAVVVQPYDGPARDLIVDIDGAQSTSALTMAIAHRLGEQGTADNLFMYSVSKRQWLNPTVEIAKCGLAQGDRVLLGRRLNNRWQVAADLPELAKVERRFGAATVEMAVVGGMEAGRRMQLTSGEASIGRGPLCTLRLNDSKVAVSHLRVSVHGTSVSIIPTAPNVFLDGEQIQGERELAPYSIVQIGDTALCVRPIVPAESLPVNQWARIPFNRPPREISPPEPYEIRLDAPPSKTDRPQLSYAAAFAPLVMGAVLFLIFKNALMLAFMGLSPIVVVWQYFENKRRGKKKGRSEEKAFRQKVEAASKELNNWRHRELLARRATEPDIAELVRRVLDHRPQLWERRRGDNDFLSLRCGIADLAPLTSVNIVEGGHEFLRRWAIERLNAQRVQPSVPFSISLTERGALGIAGDADRVERLGASLLLEIATLHSPRDVAVAAAVPSNDLDFWDWMKWLPHTNPLTSPLEGSHLALDSADARSLIERALTLIELRRGQRSEFGARVQDAFAGPALVVLLHESAAPSRALVDRLLTEGPQVGVYSIWLGQNWRDLPGSCNAVVEIQGDSHAKCSWPRTTQPTVEFLGDGTPVRICRKAALGLAPIEDVTTQNAAGVIPRVVSLLEMLDLRDPTGSAIVERWKTNLKGLAAPIGVSGDGLFFVDLQKDGPHGLVAGTTGSGKSELLQSMVASLTSRYSPARLNFLFVDYKGGTAFAECTQLPHCVGMVTDLDGVLTNRVLVSLNAELRRREAILREANAKDLLELWANHPDIAPPSLVVVIDEFAALAREVPDFVEGVVDVAQRGRSLGIHLILATQRPSGVVSENIRANTNLRISLRVADDHDSTDVIGVSDAARIPRSLPGRAYVRTGHAELTPFQAAWGGNQMRASIKGGPVQARVADLAFGAFDPISADTNVVNSDSRMTDMALVVSATQAGADILHLGAPRRPWLEPLPPFISVNAIKAPEPDPVDPAREVVFGMLDEPAKQKQSIATLDLEREGNVAVFGVGGSGKTTFLRGFAASLALRCSPDEVAIYALDFASRGLDGLRNLPQVQSVVFGESTEQVARLLTFLDSEIKSRKEKFAQAGVAAMSEYRQASFENSDLEHLPRVVVLVDGMPGFTTAFEKIDYGNWLELFQRLVSEGRSLGIHFVITADRRGGIPFGTLGVISCRVLLRMADPDELSSLGVSHQVARTAKQAPGRAFFQGDNEVQCAVVGNSPSGDAQVKALEELGNQLSVEPGQGFVRLLTGLPSHVERSSLAVLSSPLRPVIGLGDTDPYYAVVNADLTRGNFLITGPRGSGRSNALAVLSHDLRQTQKDLKVILFTPRSSWLNELPGWTATAHDADECEGAVNTLEAWAAGRPDKTALQAVIFIDDGEEFFDGALAVQLESLLATYRNVFRTVAAVDNAAALRAYGGWCAEVKRHKQGLLLQPDLAADGDLFGVRLKALPGQSFPPGRGFLVADRETHLTQVAYFPVE